MYLELIILLLAGLLGGVLNAIAGGGSFITFPALLFAGVPPISANATNTFASCAGYMSGTYAFRDSLYPYKKSLPVIIIMSLIGGVIGAYLLLSIPQAVFSEAIPWLVLLATVLFIFGEKINATIKKFASQNRHMSLLVNIGLPLMLLAVGVYGGFFNAGLGIVALSYLVLVGHTDINVMNGLKLLISTLVSFVAIILFIVSDKIAWGEGVAVLIGSLLGGYLAAIVSKQLSQQLIRRFVELISIGMTLYFFVDTYIVKA